MICNHCNKRIWFWQDKIKRFHPIDINEHILRHRVVYYHDECEPHDLAWYDRYDAKLVNTNKQVHIHHTPTKNGIEAWQDMIDREYNNIHREIPLGGRGYITKED